VDSVFTTTDPAQRVLTSTDVALSSTVARVLPLSVPLTLQREQGRRRPVRLSLSFDKASLLVNYLLKVDE
jgi:hypothetical protein